MSPAKALIVTGVVLVALGLLWLGLERILPLGRLPGDIRVERAGLRVYFPLGTMIVVSLLLTLLLNILLRFRR